MEQQPFTIEGARQAAERDQLDQWVGTFLASPGSDNAELAEELTSEPRWWIGPVQLPINRLNRLVGPPGDPVLRVVEDDDDWRDDVADLADKIDDDEVEPPPVIVMLRDGQLVLEDGNHRVEALRRAGETAAWSIVGFESADERDGFEVPA